MTTLAPLTPELEAQICRVMTKLMAAWDGTDCKPETVRQAAVGSEAAPRKTAEQYAERRAQIKAFIVKNPNARLEDIIAMFHCSGTTVQSIKRELGIDKGPKRNPSKPEIKKLLAENPELSDAEIAQRTGASKRYVNRVRHETRAIKP